MKITDYQRVTSLLDNDIFLVDGVNGTKTIKTSDLTKEIDRRGNIWDTLDDYIPVELRRNIWRGKNLGSEPPGDSVYDEIDSGTFKGLYLGDYWSVGNNIYRIVDFNYWFGTGSASAICATNHIVIMPDKSLYFAKINDTNTSSGGYGSCKMRTENLNQAKTVIKSIFGENHILSHKALFVDVVTDGVPTGGGWYDSDVDLVNITMLFGYQALLQQSTNVSIPYNFSVDTVQLSAMASNPACINANNERYWTRDIMSGYAFLFADVARMPGYVGASNVNGVRPIFGLKKSS